MMTSQLLRKSAIRFLVLLVVVGAVSAQKKEILKPRTAPKDRRNPDDPTTNECPEPNGFFADAEQCDKYYACSDGEITEKLCPDGMVFNDYSPDQEKCDLPFNIDCSQRSNRQTPMPTEHCPRRHGYFAHEDVKICDQFFYCVDGKFNLIVCPASLVFNDKTGICTWADEAKKKNCGTKDVFNNFECPPVNDSIALSHPRYADPDDCQYFFVCINGNVPRRSGCKLGQVFDDSTKRCDWSKNVPECIDWYKDQLTDAELHALENPTSPRPRPTSHAFVSQRKPQRPNRRNKPAETKAASIENSEELD